VAVHPFAGSVTVTVYVPTALTLGLAVVEPDTIPAPVQLNVAPAVDDEPFRTTEDAEQLSVCDAPALAFGAVALELTATVDVAVQPFPGSVTVTVYVPAAFTVGAAVVPPDTTPGPAQPKLAPAVEVEPLSVTEAVEQFKVCGPPAFAFGVFVSVMTVVVAVAEHPFDGSFTVTV
jgi:hypothetical protein